MHTATCVVHFDYESTVFDLEICVLPRSSKPTDPHATPLHKTSKSSFFVPQVVALEVWIPHMD
jgi:hypothetical protein